MQVSGRRYDTGEPVCVELSGDRILSVRPAIPPGRLEDWPFLAPGLFDMQINGFGGTWFSDDTLTPEKALECLQPWFRHGVTRLFPTLITNSQEALLRGFSALRQACEQTPWANRLVAGYHLEGPYIAWEDGPRGAHPRAHVRAPNWNEFQELQAASGGRIRLVTLAPEWPEAPAFIQKAVASGVVIAIGHTAATPAQVKAAVDAGATFSTHLGNGCHAQQHRHQSPLLAQLADDRLTAGLISDGHHLPSDWLNIVLKVKTPNRIVITCDASGWAGCPPGLYENKLGRSEMLPSGKLVVAGQQELLAGSGDTTEVCVARMIQATRCSLREAIDMTSVTPAQLFGQEVPKLDRGGRADLIRFFHDPAAATLTVKTTIASGILEYGDLSTN